MLLHAAEARSNSHASHAMYQTSEASFKTRDGTQLYTKTWIPDTTSSQHLIFVHGFSDHIGAYYDLFPTLASAPYNIHVHGFDQRGWGRNVSSKADCGRTGDTKQVLEDIYDFHVHVSKGITDKSAKLFMMGHSMGGAEVVSYVLTGVSSFSSGTESDPLPLAGVLVEAPHIGFPPASQPNALVVFSGRLAARFMPNMQMVQKLDSSAMSRDPQVCKDWENDELCHDTGTLKGLAGLLDRANKLNSHNDPSRQLPCPIWWAHGTGDQVCDYGCSRRLFDKLVGPNSGSEFANDSVFASYEGGYHKLHAEPNGMNEQFARDIGEWVQSIARARKATPSIGQKPSLPEATAGTESNDVRSRL